MKIYFFLIAIGVTFFSCNTTDLPMSNTKEEIIIIGFDDGYKIKDTIKLDKLYNSSFNTKPFNLSYFKHISLKITAKGIDSYWRLPQPTDFHLKINKMNFLSDTLSVGLSRSYSKILNDFEMINPDSIVFSIYTDYSVVEFSQFKIFGLRK